MPGGRMPVSRSSQGFTLIEVLIASGILVAVAGAVLSAGRASIRSHDLSLERSQASQLMQEDFEIVRQMRDTNDIDGQGSAWNAGLTTGVDEHPVWNPDTQSWQLAPGSETVQVDGTTALTFDRSLRIEPATHLATIVDPNHPGTIDPSQVALTVTVTVAWQSQGQNWVETGTTLLTDWSTGGSA